MRIGIFETEHFEGAYPIIRLFDTGEHEITIFTYEGSYRQFKFLFGDEMGRYQWIVKGEDESKYGFMRTIYRETKKRRLDLLYMNTVQDNHLFYALLVSMLPRIRIIATIHNINGYFNAKPAFNVRRCVRYIGKRLFIQSVKEFNVVSDTMVNHLKSHLPARKEVYSLPGAVYEMAVPHPVVSPAAEGIIKLVVPGTVDGRRRNYDLVFELLEKCRDAGIAVSIVLLGGFHEEYRQVILARCQNYNNLKYYTSLVDQPEFDRVMNECHIVFTPAVIDTVLFDGITETYGLSISSGNIFDIIKHAKPFISPAALRVPAAIQSSCVLYESVDDIVSFLKGLAVDDDLFRQLNKQAELNSKKYTIKVLRAQYPTLFAGAQ